MAAAASGGVQPLKVSIQITTTGARQAAGAMSNVTRATAGMNRGLGAGVIGARTLGDAMRMTASLMKYTVAGAFVNIGKQAIQMQRQFELSFSRIKGLVVVSSDVLDEMRQKVLALAGETTRAPLELADALYYITSAGIKDATTALEVLEASAKAAAAGLGTTNTVADAVTSTLNAYGAANISAARATDVLVATVREGKAEADTFAPALGKVLPVAAAYGASFEDVSAAIAALSRGGLSAGTAAIYVRQTLTQLLKPSKQAEEVLKRVGTSAEEIRKNVREKGLFEALTTLRDQIGGIDEAGDFTKVFGNVRALTAVLSLVGPAADENAKIFERLNNSAGDLEFAFKAYSDTIDADFNRALAQQQAALISIGESLKPLVTSILKFATMVAKGFATMFGTGIGKGIARVVAGLTITIAVMATLMKTSSAFIRLGSNMQLMLFGQQFQYNAVTKEVLVYNAAVVQSAIANGQAVTATTGWTVANGFLATSIRVVGASMAFMTRAMATILPILTAVMLAVQVGMWAWNKWGKNANNGATDAAKGLSKVTDLLDEAAKYGRTTFTFDITLDYETAQRQSINERIREQLEEQAPGTIQQIKEIGLKQGNAMAVAYLQGIIQTQFGGNTQEFKDNLMNFFIDTMTINKDDLEAGLNVPKNTGDALTDAVIAQAIVSARNASSEWTENFSLDPTKPIEETAKKFAEGVREKGGYSVREAFGEAFTTGLQGTRQLNPLLETLSLLKKQWTADSVSIGRQTTMMQDIVSGALTGLEGDYDVHGDKVGNLANLFNDKFASKNMQIAKDMIANTFGTTDAAEVDAIYNQLQQGMKGIESGSGGVIESFDVLNRVYDEHKQKVQANARQILTLDQAVSAIEDRFSTGYAVSISTVIDQYDAATNAMKEFQRGQEALMGIQRTMTEAQISYRESMRSLGEAAREAGGNIFSGTEKADAAQSALLDSMDAVLEVVNSFAMRGDVTGATEALGEGMTRILGQAIQNGLDEEQVMKFFEMHNFGPAMVDTLLGEADTTGAEAENIGTEITAGIAKGIEAGRDGVNSAIDKVGNDVIERLKKRLGIESPSRVMAEEVGKPTAEGFVVGFATEMRGRSSRLLGKSLEKAVLKAYKGGGRAGANKFFQSFLEKKGDVETPAADFVAETIGRMRDIVGSLGDYIKSQLNFRRAQADLAKLINMQRGLDDRRRKAAREQQYSETRFGRGGGAEVTSYEQARIDELQLQFERTSRDYAMGRTTYTDLVDAEIALFEARAAAAEVNDDVLSAQNSFIDATVNAENQQLELASATVEVLSAYQEVQESAAQLYINHKELAGIYTSLAQATGIASGKLQIGKTDITKLGGEVEKLGGYVTTVGTYTSTLGNNISITGQAFDTYFNGDDGVFANIIKAGGDIQSLTSSIGAEFTNLSKGLLDEESEMYKNLQALGPAIFRAIRIAAQDALAKSPLNLSIPAGTTTSGGGGGGNDTGAQKDLGGERDLGGDVAVTLKEIWQERTQTSRAFINRSKTKSAKAVGGPVVGGFPYMVGERGPEMFLPNVSGTIVTTSALDRYMRVRERQSGQSATGQNNIVVTVNNPVPQAAEESITRRMKVLSNSGLFG